MSFAYDRLGRMERTVDQNGYEVGYAHDAMGRRELLEYPDESYITYEYDNIGRLQYIKDENGYKIVEYVYDTLSRTTQVLYFRGQSSVGSMAYAYEDKVPASGDQLGNRIARMITSHQAPRTRCIIPTTRSAMRLLSAPAAAAITVGHSGMTRFTRCARPIRRRQTVRPRGRMTGCITARCGRIRWTV